MSTLHIFRAGHQPATRFKVDVSLENKPIWIRFKPRRQLRAHCCGKLHYAKNLTVQVYYDGDYFWCKPGFGCYAK